MTFGFVDRRSIRLSYGPRAGWAIGPASADDCRWRGSSSELPTARVRPLDLPTSPASAQVVEIGERELQAPGGGGRVEVLRADELGGRPRTRCAARRRARRALGRAARRPRRGSPPTFAGDVAKRAPVAGEAEAGVEALDERRGRRGTRRPGPACGRSRRTARRGRAGGRRRSAGRSRAGGGRRARARGPASRAPARRRGRSRPPPRRQVAVGRDRAHDAAAPGRGATARSARARPAARRSGGRPRSAGRALASGSSTEPADVLPGRVHPQLAAGRVDDRPREAVVVGVGVGADQQPHVGEPRTPPGARASSSWRGPSVGRHPGVEEDDPVAGATANAFTRGTPGQGSGRRRRQTPGRTRSPRPSSRGVCLESKVAHARMRGADPGTIGGVADESANNAALIDRFYSAFARKDARRWPPATRPMRTSHDPSFRTCTATRRACGGCGSCERGLRPQAVEHSERAQPRPTPARRTGWPTTPSPGQPAVRSNVDRGELRFKNGLIAEHRDDFDLWRGRARRALGPVGLLAGWSPPAVQNKVRGQARDNLRAFMADLGDRLSVGHVLARRRARADPRQRRGDDRGRGVAAPVRAAARARRQAARAGAAVSPEGDPDAAQPEQPEWTADPRFDIRWHVRRAALPDPGSTAELRELAGRIFSEPLDFTRPLWQLYLIEGLEGNRHAYVNKTHHALVDGVAAVDVAAVILDASPEGMEIEISDEPADPAAPSPEARFRPRRLRSDPRAAACCASGGARRRSRRRARPRRG